MGSKVVLHYKMLMLLFNTEMWVEKVKIHSTSRICLACWPLKCVSFCSFFYDCLAQLLCICVSLCARIYLGYNPKWRINFNLALLPVIWIHNLQRISCQSLHMLWHLKVWHDINIQQLFLITYLFLLMSQVPMAFGELFSRYTDIQWHHLPFCVSQLLYGHLYGPRNLPKR